MKPKNIVSYLLLFVLTTSATAQTAYTKRKEFRSDCNGKSSELIGTEEYNSDQKLVHSTRGKKRNTDYTYDDKGNLTVKIHRDSTGKTLRFNKIYFNANNEYFIDTLFNADSSANTVFKRRHSKKINEDIITWDILGQKGSTIIQTIKLDDQKNELENNICTSSSECTVVKNTFSGKLKVKSESFRREEMNRKPILTETQTFEYDSSNRLVKTTVMNEVDKVCSFVLTYGYE